MTHAEKIRQRIMLLLYDVEQEGAHVELTRTTMALTTAKRAMEIYLKVLQPADRPNG